ncbi:MAG: hypothetical protein KatS3mg038_3176 [Candidatus Kapaibacterium sp.]|nr:MAG: hypothetical protein KatS3mg038_2120 [Candidatus Kapabacteria bacterium]GIV52438.1 MAG: hypothetical protein KatS3mg038_2959 [Candidatus Kapabacteria bacterium]GIV52655.1 MAG: hypothetical protein KatS3mg038_3176 [Candidatus Kapabacteria bacterium]
MDSRLNDMTNAWAIWRWRAMLLGITPEQVARCGMRWFLAIVNGGDHDVSDMATANNQDPKYEEAKQ